MSDDGYTLLEMLVALTVVGLTAAGVAGGAFALARIQGQASGALTTERSVSMLQGRFADFLRGRGPFRSDDKRAGLQGSADQLEFPCGEGACTAQLIQTSAGTMLDLGLEDGTESQLPLPGVAGASFAYEDGEAEWSEWPPSKKGARLRSVIILGGFEPDQRPLAIASLDVAQSANCEFDPILKDCRAGSDERR